MCTSRKISDQTSLKSYSYCFYFTIVDKINRLIRSTVKEMRTFFLTYSIFFVFGPDLGMFLLNVSLKSATAAE
jgi:hypothetical protein